MFVSKKTKERAAKFGRDGLLGDKPGGGMSSGQRDEPFSGMRRGSSFRNNDRANDRRGFNEYSHRSGGGLDQQVGSFGSQKQGSQNQVRGSYRGEKRGGTFGSDRASYSDFQGKGSTHDSGKRGGGLSYMGSQGRDESFNRNEGSYFSSQKNSATSRSDFYGGGNSRNADSPRRGNTSFMDSRGGSAANMNFGRDDHDSYRDQGQGQQRNDNFGNQWQRNQNRRNDQQRDNSSNDNQQQGNRDRYNDQRRNNDSYNNQQQVGGWDRYSNQERDNDLYNKQQQGGGWDRYSNQQRDNASYNNRQQGGGNNRQAGGGDYYNDQRRDDPMYNNQQQGSWDRYNNQRRDSAPYNDQHQGNMDRYNDQQRDRSSFNDREQGGWGHYDDRRRDNASHNDRQERDNASYSGQQRGGNDFYGDRGSGDRFDDRERGYGNRYNDQQRGNNSAYSEQQRGSNAPFNDQQRRGGYNSYTNQQRGDNASGLDQERGGGGTKSFMQHQQRGNDWSYEGMGREQERAGWKEDDSKEPTRTETMAALGILQKVLAKQHPLPQPAPPPAPPPQPQPQPPQQQPAPPPQPPPPQPNFQGFRKEFDADHNRLNPPSFGGSTRRMRSTRFSSPQAPEPEPEIIDWSQLSRFKSGSAADILSVMDNLQSLRPAAVSSVTAPGRHLIDETWNSPVNIDDFRIRDQSLHRSLTQASASRKRQLEVMGLPDQKRSRTSILSRLGPKKDVLSRITKMKGDVKSRLSRKGPQNDESSKPSGKLPLSKRLGPRNKVDSSGGDGGEAKIKMDTVQMKKLASKYNDFPRKWLHCHICKLKTFRGAFEFLLHHRSGKHERIEKCVEDKIDAMQNYLSKAAQYAFAAETRVLKKSPEVPLCDVCNVPQDVGGKDHKRIAKECKILHEYLDPFRCSCGKKFADKMVFERHCLTFLHIKKMQEAKMDKLECDKEEEERLNELKEIFTTGSKEDENGEPLNIDFTNAAFEKEAMIYQEFGEQKVPKEVLTLLRIYKNEEKRQDNLHDKKECDLEPFDASHKYGTHNVTFVTDVVCVLCDTLIENSKESILEHCSSEEHYNNVVVSAENKQSQIKEQREQGEKDNISTGEQKKVNKQIKSSSKETAEEEEEEDSFSMTGNLYDDSELFGYNAAEEGTEEVEEMACKDENVSVENSENVDEAESNKSRKSKVEEYKLGNQPKGTVKKSKTSGLGKRVLGKGRGGSLALKENKDASEIQDTQTLESASQGKSNDKDGGEHKFAEKEKDRKDESSLKVGDMDSEAIGHVEEGSGMDEGEADIVGVEEGAGMIEIEDGTDMGQVEDGTLIAQVEEGAGMGEVEEGADMVAEDEYMVADVEDGADNCDVEDRANMVEVEDGAGMGEAEDEAGVCEAEDEADVGEAEDEADVGEAEDEADVGEAEEEADVGEAEEEADVGEAEEEADLGEAEDEAYVGEAEDEADVGEAEDEADVDEAEDEADVGEAKDEAYEGEDEEGMGAYIEVQDRAEVYLDEGRLYVGEGEEGANMGEVGDRGDISEDEDASETENESDNGEDDEEAFLVTDEQEGEEPVEVNLSDEEEEIEEIDLTAGEGEEGKSSAQTASLRERKNMFRF